MIWPGRWSACTGITGRWWMSVTGSRSGWCACSAPKPTSTCWPTTPTTSCGGKRSGCSRWSTVPPPWSCPTVASTAGVDGWFNRRSPSSESTLTRTSSSPSSTGRWPGGVPAGGWTPTPNSERRSDASWYEPCSATRWVTSPTRSANGWSRPCATCNEHRCRDSTSTCGGTATAVPGLQHVRSTSSPWPRSHAAGARASTPSPAPTRCPRCSSRPRRLTAVRSRWAMPKCVIRYEASRRRL